MFETFRYLLPYIRRYRWKYITGALFLVLTNVFRITNPRIVQTAIDYLGAAFSLGQLGWYALAVIGVAISEGIFLFLWRRSMIVASREIENDLRNDFFERLTEMSPSFYQEMPTGDIMSRATNDLNAVRSMLGPGIAYSTNALLAIFFVLPMMYIISPTLMLWALLPFPVIAVLVNRFGKAIYHRFERIQAQLSTLSTRAQENISGSTIIKWFARENYEVAQFSAENDEYMRRNIHYVKVQAAFHPSIALTIGIAMALILYFGGQLVMRSAISLGEFTAFILYMNIMIWPAIALGWVVGLFQQGAASLKRMRNVLDAEPELRDRPDALPVTALKGDIRFRGLGFQYVPGTDVLADIDLHIPAHSTVGIIGPTGSGKSTLIKLIPLLHQLPEGVLAIDGRDIHSYQLASLRSRIGYVPQETFLFSDTLYNNIAYGKPDATAEEVERAAKMAAVHEEILGFRDGYQSMLGEKGLNLSGGQKQRVAFARALIRQPDILILDDAFSALDTHTEDTILSGLREFLPDRTVILVSHRVSTLQESDFIVVLENGKIAEIGKHSQLIGQGGLYAWIHEKQLLEEELESVQ